MLVVLDDQEVRLRHDRASGRTRTSVVVSSGAPQGLDDDAALGGQWSDDLDHEVREAQPGRRSSMARRREPTRLIALVTSSTSRSMACWTSRRIRSVSFI